MPNWIGDLVMATPILTDVRKAFPKAHITAMSLNPLCELLSEDPDIDELFCFNKVNAFGRRSERKDLIEKIRQGKFDLGILLTHSFSSAWWFWRGRVKNRLGYRGKGRRFLLTNSLPLPEDVQEQHLVKTYKGLLTKIGVPVSDSKPRLYFTEKELDEARTLLRQFGIEPKHRLVGINPGAAYGSAKCWLPERFREVTKRLLEKEGVKIVYFGDQGGRGLTEEICKGLDVVNLAGSTTLRQLGALIKLCCVLLTNDSGPMHIAAAVGTPVVALFGSTNAEVTGPYETKASRVIYKKVECSPCYKRVCPIDFRCMKRIESDEVYEAILSFLC
jgi:lipopolysaccharide heptosyltransferase II